MPAVSGWLCPTGRRPEQLLAMSEWLVVSSAWCGKMQYLSRWDIVYRSVNCLHPMRARLGLNTARARLVLSLPRWKFLGELANLQSLSCWQVW